ncbi:Arc family DNA-binding protein [Luteolibacter sp. Populi]|uniref:FitA-like ribbon-helix-helix domain-containing protein n=1 Tax=Luteolibacter sp. Populi TaxID=3230487 RepID=UPI0034665EA2
MSTTLTIRNLDEGVEEKLRMRAAIHQRSMEAEVREILTRSVAEDSSLTPPLLSAQERMRKAIASVRGSWADRGTTDQWMQASRADDSDDAYSGR